MSFFKVGVWQHMRYTFDTMPGRRSGLERPNNAIFRAEVTSLRTKLLRGESLARQDTELLESEDGKRSAGQKAEIEMLKTISGKSVRKEPLSEHEKEYLRTGKMYIAPLPPVTVHTVNASEKVPPPNTVSANILEDEGVEQVSISEEAPEKLEIDSPGGKKTIAVFNVRPSVSVNYGLNLEERVQDSIVGLVFDPETQLVDPVNEVINRNFVLCHFPRGTAYFRSDIIKFFEKNSHLVPANVRDLIEFHRVFEYPEPEGVKIIAFDPRPEANKFPRDMPATIYAYQHRDRYNIELSRSEHAITSEPDMQTYILAYKR